jgi:hypothetical protein
MRSIHYFRREITVAGIAFRQDHALKATKNSKKSGHPHLYPASGKVAGILAFSIFQARSLSRRQNGLAHLCLIE